MNFLFRVSVTLCTTIFLVSCASPQTDYATLPEMELLGIACASAEHAYLESNNEYANLFESEKAFRVLAERDKKYLENADDVQQALSGDSNWNVTLHFCGIWRYQQLQSQPTNLESPEAKRELDLAVTSYLKQDCAPKYWTTNDDGFKYARMTPYFSEYYTPGSFDPQLSTQEWMYLDSSTSTSYYGNFAVRTLFLSSVYHYLLSGIYPDLYSESIPEFNKFKSTFVSFRKIADNSSKRVCKIVNASRDSSQLSQSELAEIGKAFDPLLANWKELKSWIESVETVKRVRDAEINSDYQDLITPECNEYPTADGNYLVIKCEY